MDINKIREAAILFLNIEPEPNKELPSLIVHHPFFNQTILPYTNKDGKLDMFDYRDKEKYEIWKKEREKIINESDIWKILMLMNSAYYMEFFILISSLITDKNELAEILKYVWVSEEYPNFNTRHHLDEILNIFKEVKNNIMDESERKIFENLDDIVTVYRGQAKPGKRYKALSWTLDYDKAKWFANRYNSNGTVYKAKISKKYIYAILNNRNEMEVIVDYKKLKNIESL